MLRHVQAHLLSRSKRAVLRQQHRSSAAAAAITTALERDASSLSLSSSSSSSSPSSSHPVSWNASREFTSSSVNRGGEISDLQDEGTIPVPSAVKSSANITPSSYREMYARSVGPNAASFWCEQAQERLTWEEDFTTTEASVMGNISMKAPGVNVEWFQDGKLNACVQCVDRHVDTRGDQVAIEWEGDTPGESRSLTYSQLLEEVSRLGNALRGLGVGAGDSVIIVLPQVSPLYQKRRKEKKKKREAGRVHLPPPLISPITPPPSTHSTTHRP